MAAEGRNIDAYKREFLEFLDDSENSNNGRYIEKLKQCIAEKNFRLVINVNHLRKFNAELATNLIKRPREYIMALREAATESAQNDDPTVAKVLKLHELQVGFEGFFGLNLVSPRGLLSSFLNNLVEVEGIVTKVSSVKPKLVRSVQFCASTGEYKVLEHRDDTSADIGIEVRGRVRLPTNGTLPKEDAEGNPMDLEQGLSTYKDYQTIVLQEMPERAKVGQLPRSIELILEYDLVDKVKPGDRVQCVGVYQPLAAPMAQGSFSGFFRPVLICNNISVIGKEVGAVLLTGHDVQNIKEVASRDSVLNIMARSLCPSIFGHEFIKKALILQLLGGCERNLANGTHLRGDINVMMVGDPSTAKSQLLRAVLDIAPLAISTTGRGSSGVGLTAAVTVDSETGEKRLEAGAMVLADRGVVCIDEFDKMGENDRVAIHEVMEQQTVTIAKAGIHASLNARCSVLAAANPVYGQYDRSRRPQENIGLPDSLLSRFDLLFIVLDQLDPALDRQLSVHVIRSHQYRRPGTIMEPEQLNQTSSLNLDDTAEEAVDTQVWQRGGKAGAAASKGDGRAGDTLTKDFLRKYIHYAKSRIHPVLSETAMEGISAAYVSMRSKQNQKNLPVTARSLETLIRLSSANAKARLCQSVDDEDVEAAVELMNFVLFHEIGDVSTGPSSGADSRGNFMGEVPSGRRGRNVGSGSSEEERGKRARLEEEEDEDSQEQYRNESQNASSSSSSSSSASSSALSSSSSSQFLSEDLRGLLMDEFTFYLTDLRADECRADEFLTFLQSKRQSAYDRLNRPSLPELIQELETFQDTNQIMIRNSEDENGEEMIILVAL